MEISVLASGSSGNCFFCRANGSSILIDAGISCRQIEERLAKVRADIKDIDAVFITHEHVDHVRGLNILTKHHSIPVYMTKGTYDALYYPIGKRYVSFIRPGQTVDINGSAIIAIHKSHDCLDPVSFKVTADRTATFLTDVGVACDHVKEAVRDSDILVLEANHDEQMLHTGPYPKYLKKRIASEVGHLSNYDAALLILEHAPANLKHVFLSHMSLVNNTDSLAVTTFNQVLKERKDLKPELSLTYRDRPTELISL
jgi:phosphoribosyl 1,2-cyclic phosphodiesterase